MLEREREREREREEREKREREEREREPRIRETPNFDKNFKIKIALYQTKKFLVPD